MRYLSCCLSFQQRCDKHMHYSVLSVCHEHLQNIPYRNLLNHSSLVQNNHQHPNLEVVGVIQMVSYRQLM